MVYTDIYIRAWRTTWRSKKDSDRLYLEQNTYLLGRIVEVPDNRILYYLQDGPDRAFVNEELMHVSEDTQVPPEWLS